MAKRIGQRNGVNKAVKIKRCGMQGIVGKEEMIWYE